MISFLQTSRKITIGLKRTITHTFLQSIPNEHVFHQSSFDLNVGSSPKSREASDIVFRAVCSDEKGLATVFGICEEHVIVQLRTKPCIVDIIRVGATIISLYVDVPAMLTLAGRHCHSTTIRCSLSSTPIVILFALIGRKEGCTTAFNCRVKHLIPDMIPKPLVVIFIVVNTALIITIIWVSSCNPISTFFTFTIFSIVSCIRLQTISLTTMRYCQ